MFPRGNSLDSLQALQAPVQSGSAEWGSGLGRAALGTALAVSLSSVPCTLIHTRSCSSQTLPVVACRALGIPQPVWVSQWCLFSWFKVPVSSRAFPRSSCRKAAWCQALALPCDWPCSKTFISTGWKFTTSEVALRKEPQCPQWLEGFLSVTKREDSLCLEVTFLVHQELPEATSHLSPCYAVGQQLSSGSGKNSRYPETPSQKVFAFVQTFLQSKNFAIGS